MLTPAEIKGMSDRKYSAYLRSLITGETIFPLRIKFGIPSSTDEFAKLRQEVTDLVSGNFGYTIEWEEKDTRKWGRQKLPTQVRFDTEQQFVASLGKQVEVAKFKENLTLTSRRLPQLRSWLLSHSKSLVENESVWQSVVAVCEYFLANPKPGLYMRELPIPVHTKFIAENRQVVASMLESILPDAAKSEGETFEERFGLKRCEPLVRFRLLDPELMQRLGMPQDELGLPVGAFRALAIADVRVLITENLMNFVCLPAITKCVAIFGHGNAAELLAQIEWLHKCDAFYWGDIDEHGFHILSRLRSHFPHLKSLLMDIATLNRHKDLAGEGELAGKAPQNLTREEFDAYQEVARHGWRIEQEKIPQIEAIQALKGYPCA
jgi:hypothetical protein